jgi:hypothetical protein
MRLKWSRSRKIALSGEAVRLACAAIRLSESSTARLFGSPVSASVGVPPMPTSTEPITSPPTSSGWQTEASGSLPQISHSMISSEASLRS